MKSLKDNLIDLAILRSKLEIRKKDLKQQQILFNLQNADLLSKIKDTNQDISESDAEIRRLALEEYKATKETKLIGGVEIKLFKTYLYDDVEAFNWAKEHKLALKLDKSKFKRIVKVDCKDMNFVNVIEDPRVQIPKEL